ncbi:MAG: hypothetical protein LBH14_07075 [Desulfobulbaceae bacterium]|jgi:hypothetical protein|nr:hypothetical protein [Desulfobulbaceae bacterium]
MRKTDNSNLRSKLALRRYFLQKYPPVSVLDCCQGTGALWRTLRREFAPPLYFPVDLKPKKGRIKIDSSRLLAAGNWHFDCIDIDTYGEPWRHWRQVVEHGRGAITVFLTCGLIRVGGGSVSDEVAKWCGLGPLLEMAPRTLLTSSCAPIAVAYAINRAITSGFSILEALESSPSRHARYFGVRMVRD